MLRNYAKSGRAHTPVTNKTPPSENPLRELQNQYARILTTCYELYAEGKRCLFEEDPLKLFDCSNCEHSDADHFCRSNLFLKKLVKLIAEHLAQRNGNPSSSQAVTDEERIPCASFTPEQIEEFKRKGVSYEIETPLCAEHVWFVPERTDQDRVEFTPEEMNFLIQTADAVEGKFIEIGTRKHTATNPESAQGEKTDGEIV